jgi:hypothetical protein
MLRHLPSDAGAAEGLPSVAPADGRSIQAAALRALCFAAVIGRTLPCASR